MATITTTARAFYANGAATSNNLVGYQPGGPTRNVVRYTFSTSGVPAGASSVLITASSNINDYWALYAGSWPTLRFKITTSSTSHTNAGPTTTDYDGTVSFTKSGSAYYLTIPTTNIVLLPNTTYYLYIFGGSTTNGVVSTYATNLTLTVSGGAGIVKIYNGSKWENYQCYIYNGSKWELYLPYVYSGSAWALY